MLKFVEKFAELLAAGGFDVQTQIADKFRSVFVRPPFAFQPREISQLRQKIKGIVAAKHNEHLRQQEEKENTEA